MDSVWATSPAQTGGNVPSGTSGRLAQTLIQAGDIEYLTDAFNIQRFFTLIVRGVWDILRETMPPGFPAPVVKDGRQTYRRMNAPLLDVPEDELNIDDAIMTDQETGETTVNPTNVPMRVVASLDMASEERKAIKRELALRLYDRGVMGSERMLRELGYEDPEEIVREAREGHGVPPSQLQVAQQQGARGTEPSLPSKGMGDSSSTGTSDVGNTATPMSQGQ
jgi:hypothetical protein